MSLRSNASDDGPASTPIQRAQLACILLVLLVLGGTLVWLVRAAPCMNASSDDAPCLCSGAEGIDAIRQLGEPIVAALEAYRGAHGVYPAEIVDAVPAAAPSYVDGDSYWVYERTDDGFALRYCCGWALSDREYSYNAREGVWVESTTPG